MLRFLKQELLLGMLLVFALGLNVSPGRSSNSLETINVSERKTGKVIILHVDTSGPPNVVTMLKDLSQTEIYASLPQEFLRCRFLSPYITVGRHFSSTIGHWLTPGTYQ